MTSDLSISLNTSSSVSPPLTVAKTGKVSKGLKHLLRGLSEEFILSVHEHLLSASSNGYDYQPNSASSSYHVRMQLNSAIHADLLVHAHHDLGYLADRYMISFACIFSVCIIPLFKRGSKLASREDIMYLLAETFVFNKRSVGLTAHGESLFQDARLALDVRPSFYPWISTVCLLNYSERSARFVSGFDSSVSDNIFNVSDSSRIGSDLEQTFCSTPSKIKRCQSSFPLISAKKPRMGNKILVPSIRIELCTEDQIANAICTEDQIADAEPSPTAIIATDAIEPVRPLCIGCQKSVQTDLRILPKVRNFSVQCSFPEALSFESVDLDMNFDHFSEDSLHCELPTSVDDE